MVIFLRQWQKYRDHWKRSEGMKILSIIVSKRFLKLSRAFPILKGFRALATATLRISGVL